MPALAAVVIAGKLVTGVWFLGGPVAGTRARLAYTAEWWRGPALDVQAFARGLAIDNCGCFRYLPQRRGWLVLAQDGFLLMNAPLLIRAAQPGVRTRSAIAAHD